MKVMIIEPLGDGGIAHYTYNLIKALIEKNIDVYLYTNKYYEFINENLSCHIYNRMFRLAYFLVRLLPWLAREYSVPNFIRRVIKVVEYPVNIIETVFILYKNKISIVHFQTVNQIELLMIAVFKIIGIKIIYTIHNVKPRHQNFKFYHPRLYKLIYGFCDHLVIHSEQGRQEICELFAISPDKVSVIPHGDYKFFMNDQSLTKEEAKINLGLMPDDKTILFFGAIRESKGLKNIVLALPDIIKCVKHIKLLIVGEPCHDYSIYRALINSGKLEDYVYEDLKYIQNQEVSKYFSAADIVVLPYNDITQSGVLQIAYAFGKPVIATAIGGFLEAVLDGKNGFLFPKDDIKCLSQKVIEILSDQDKMTAMGDYSRYLSDNKYSWDTISEETSKIYSELI